MDPKGWLVRFGDHNLTARFFDSTRDINGIYLCTVVVVHDTETIVMNMTVILTVIGEISGKPWFLLLWAKLLVGFCFLAQYL